MGLEGYWWQDVIYPQFRDNLVILAIFLVSAIGWYHLFFGGFHYLVVIKLSTTIMANYSKKDQTRNRLWFDCDLVMLMMFVGIIIDICDIPQFVLVSQTTRRGSKAKMLPLLRWLPHKFHTSYKFAFVFIRNEMKCKTNIKPKAIFQEITAAE